MIPHLEEPGWVLGSLSAPVHFLVTFCVLDYAAYLKMLSIPIFCDGALLPPSFLFCLSASSLSSSPVASALPGYP